METHKRDMVRAEKDMKYSMRVFALLGLMSLAGGSIGVIWPPETPRTLPADLPIPSALLVAFGAFMILLAYGMHRRSLIAYWGVWIWLPMGQALFIWAFAAIVRSLPPSAPAWVAVLGYAIIGGTAVWSTFVGVRYWRALRVCFRASSPSRSTHAG